METNKKLIDTIEECTTYSNHRGMDFYLEARVELNDGSICPVMPDMYYFGYPLYALDFDPDNAGEVKLKAEPVSDTLFFWRDTHEGTENGLAEAALAYNKQVTDKTLQIKNHYFEVCMEDTIWKNADFEEKMHLPDFSDTLDILVLVELSDGRIVAVDTNNAAHVINHAGDDEVVIRSTFEGVTFPEFTPGLGTFQKAELAFTKQLQASDPTITIKRIKLIDADDQTTADQIRTAKVYQTPEEVASDYTDKVQQLVHEMVSRFLAVNLPEELGIPTRDRNDWFKPVRAYAILECADGMLTVVAPTKSDGEHMQYALREVVIGTDGYLHLATPIQIHFLDWVSVPTERLSKEVIEKAIKEHNDIVGETNPRRINDYRIL